MRDSENARDSGVREIPSLGEWLYDAIKASGMTQKAVAATLGITAPQLNNMLHGRETINRHYVTDISRAIGLDETQIEFAERLCDCQAAIALLRGMVTEKLKSHKIVKNFELSEKLLELAFRLAGKYHSVIDISFLRLSYFYLQDAAFAVRAFAKLLGDDGRYIIEQEDLARHLRYPVNYFIAEIMTIDKSIELESPRELVIGSLRDIVEAENPHGQSLSVLCLHAIHLLGRYGDVSDKEFVDSVRKKSESNVFSKRMILFAKMLRENAEDSVKEIEWNMQNDDAFSEHAVVFDAIHYGDHRFSGEFSRMETNYKKALLHILRTADAETNSTLLEFHIARLINLIKFAKSVERHDLEVRTLCKRIIEAMDLSGEKSGYMLKARDVIIAFINQSE